MMTIGNLNYQIQNQKDAIRNDLMRLLDGIDEEISETACEIIEERFSIIESSIPTELNRVEVITGKHGRAYVGMNLKNVELSLQDNNKTLKIFVK